jgi:hypothetical protein
LALILWQRSLCNKLQAFSGVLEEGVSTENIDIPLGCSNNRLHSATHHSAHHSAALSTALSTGEAATARSTLSTGEATTARSTLSAWEATTTRSTLTAKSWASTLLSALTLLSGECLGCLRLRGCLCLSCRVDGSKTSSDESTKCDTGNHLLIHGNSPENQQWEFVAFIL